MKFKNYLYLLFAVALAGASFAQQQTVFTNILLNQYLYNPAYAGVDTGTTFNAAYRNQWVGFDGAPKTYVFSGYGNFKKKPNMTIGGLISTERVGLLLRTGFYGSYAYKLKINKKYAISFGLSLGAVQYNVKAYDAKPYDADDQFLQSPTLNAIAFDANAGFYFYSKKFFLGFSNQQMPNSKIRWANSEGKLTPHFYAYTGYNIYFDKRGEWILQPSVLARTDNPAPYQLEGHLKLLYKSAIWLGASYRGQSSFKNLVGGGPANASYQGQSSLSALIGAKVNNQFTFGYSYDYTLSKLSNYSSGSHEIVLSFLIPFKKKKTAADKAKEADENELNTIDNTLKTNLKKKKGDSSTKPAPSPATEPARDGDKNDTKKAKKQPAKKETKYKKKSNKDYKKG